MNITFASVVERPTESIATGVLAAAGIGMLVGALDERLVILYRLALAVAVLAGVTLCSHLARCTLAQQEAARQRGYDDGYADGESVSVGRVVGLRSADRAALTLTGAAHEFGEQADLGGGSERIG